MAMHGFPEVFAVSLTENILMYRDNPDAWVKGTDFEAKDVSLCHRCAEAPDY
jgi:hypothetical protein